MSISDDLARRLAEGEVIVLDGGVSTELQRRGVPIDNTSWFGSANLDHIEAVQALHEDYIRAGSQVIIANTYANSRAGLEPAGLGDRVKESNERAVEAAKRARDAAADRPVAVAGSISSFFAGAMGSHDSSDLRTLSTFREQATSLAEAGVDLLALEMMDHPDQYGLAAVEAALETGLPVWLGMSPIRFAAGRLGMYPVDEPCIVPTTLTPTTLANAATEPTDAKASDASPAEPKELTGPSFEEVVKTYASAHPRGLAAITLMHTKVGVVPDAIPIVQRYFPDLPVGVYAEVGDWKPPKWIFSDYSAEEYVTAAKDWVDAGVQMVGGCCGTGPEHVRALTEGLPGHIRVPAGHSAASTTDS